MLHVAERLSSEDLSKVLSTLHEARTKWCNIGLGIGIDPTTIEAIGINNRDNVDDCFRELLVTWLRKGNSKCTWATLVAVLKSKTVGLGWLSEEVRQKHLLQLPTQIGNGMNACLHSNNGTESHPQLTDVSSFQCPCGKCDLIDYLDQRCPKATSSAYPYLEYKGLTPDDRDDLVQKLSADTSVMISCFADLRSYTRESLKRKEIKVKELANVAVDHCLQISDEDYNKAESIDDVFFILRNYTSFFNHELLGKITKKYSDNDNKLEQKYEEFCTKFKEFCQRKIFQISPTIFSNVQGRDHHKRFVVLTTKQLIITLNDAKTAQIKIATVLGLKASQVHLEQIDSGSVILVFSIPMALSQKVFPLKPAVYEELKSYGYTLIVPPIPTRNTCEVTLAPFVSVTVTELAIALYMKCMHNNII